MGMGKPLRAGEPKPFANSVADEINPAFSPDGKWLAYSSTQTGTFTIYVRSLQGTDATWQVSAEEGFLPKEDKSFSIPCRTTGSGQHPTP
jgi:serine/threonine-protein kinase